MSDEVESALIGLQYERALFDRFVAINVLGHLTDFAAAANLHASVVTLAEQHVDDLLGASVTEELAQFLLVISDAVFFNQGNKVRGCVAGER